VGHNDGNYSVVIEDDGKGFDTAQPTPGGHFGLQIMQARAKHIGGRVELQSEIGRGTRVTLIWSEETRG
jgi:two-component system nitrate/nitrite sensor histidine kinase NarX